MDKGDMTEEERKNFEDRVARRDKYLAENPHLLEHQAEIDRILDACVGDENRQAAVWMMLSENLSVLTSGLMDLYSALNVKDAK